jgi:DNA polymerase III alpha subunit|tara:strand:+ start:6660 stop:7184 length:525 start_codon:yes stop_codon:yes gene_type:complete
MKTDSLGIPRFTNKDLIDMIYSGHADKVHVVLCDANDDVDKFNEVCDLQGHNKLQKYIPLDVDQKTFDGVCQSEWFMPDAYKAINVYEYVLQKVETPCPQHVQDRVWEELDAFKERDMINLLRYMIYLVDFMRENDIVWGVGRGSSVASYVLYLIGVHKINSIQFDLDWREFLR